MGIFDTSYPYPAESADRLHIAGYDHEDGSVVAPEGELDIASAPLLSGYFGRLAAGGRSRVVADFANLDFCDCAGLGVLLRAHRRYTAAGGWLRLCAARPSIQKTLHITRLAGVLVCYPNVAAAFLGMDARQ